MQREKNNPLRTINMRRIIINLFATCLCCVCVFLNSCQADVDLNNIDTTASVKAKLATPIGHMSVSIGDFLGDGTMGIYVDTLEHKGVLTFKDTFTIARKFHDIDLSQYVSSTTLKMNVFDQLADVPFFIDGKITGADVQIPLVFPVNLKLSGINHNESYQRIDSVQVENARFISNISVMGGLPLEWEWIDKVELTLGSNFHRADGTVLTIYDSARDKGYGYNQDIEINVDNFSLDLMKRKDADMLPKDYWGNVIDSCNMKVTMYVTIPSTAGQITIPAGAGFSYDLSVKELNYKAVWGMFEASGDMSNADEISLSESWDAWEMLGDMRLPFAEPSIRMDVTTQIAGALRMQGDYLYVIGRNGEKVYATFNQEDQEQLISKPFLPDNWLPLNSQIGDSSTMHLLFDKHPLNGHIDRLFTVLPDKLGYKFDVDFDRETTPQIRISDNTNIRIDAICNLPFIFNEGVALNYGDTMALNSDLSGLSLDSMLADIEMIDTISAAELKLALAIESTIPLQMKAVLRCLDAEGNVLMNPIDSTKPFLLTEQDTILIPSPTYTHDKASNSWNVSTNKMVETITVDEQKMEVISNIHQIVYNVSLDDKAMEEAYKNNYDNIKLTEHERLRIFIGIGADVEAILKLNL